MQREPEDINKEAMDESDIEKLELRRLDELNEAGIDENQVITQAHKDINTWMAYFGDNITRGKADLDFAVRDQWTAQERADFMRLQKPPMTFNKIYDPVKKILGEQRKNKPDLIVRALNGRVDQEQLDLRTDLVRTISYQSQNDLVYQTAFKSALLMGFGAFQVSVDFESPRSFNKIIKYMVIPDPTRCAWDPTAVLPHKGDGNFCSRTYLLTRNEFFATYPYITNPVSFTDPYMLVDYQWQTRDTICIEEMYKKEWYPIKIVELSNGMSVSEYEWEEAQAAFKRQKEIVAGSIVARIIENGIPHATSTRQSEDYKIMRYLMLRDRIIDFEEWPSRHLPMPFVDGDSYYSEGRQFTKSFIHDSKDAQKSVNYFNSEIAAEIKNRRREQWLGTAENISGYEQIWRNPEVQVGMLPAKPDPKTGQMPMKQMAWGMAPELMQNSQRATQDIKEILGFSEQEVLNSRDMSGVARRERKLEGGLAAYIYFDNLNQAIAQSGRIVNDLLPHIIGHNERHMSVSKPGGKISTVVFNHEQKDGSIKNKLIQGDFDVEIDAGPSFAVQKEIALEMFQQTLQVNPQAFPLIADLWAKNLDLQYQPQIVERFKTMVPPEIIAKEDGTPMPPQKPNPQQMMAQQQMMMQHQEMMNKQEAIKQKGQQIQMDQARLKNDAIEMLANLQSDQQEHTLEKQKLIVELNKIAQGHAVDLHKAHLKHSIDLHNALNANKNSE